MERIAHYEFSKGYRLTHWIRFFAIMVLIVSGLYLAYAFQSPSVSGEPILFLQAKWRFAHIVAGFVMIGALFFKTYLFFFDRMSRIERVAVKDFINPKIWIQQIAYYLFLTDKHPDCKGTYNPLQFFAYVIFYLTAFFICLTGAVLYVHVYHQGLGGLLYGPMRAVEAWMDGLASVRAIHHICMDVILVFIVAHVYMAVFNAIKGKDGGMDTVFSGYRFIKK